MNNNEYLNEEKYNQANKKLKKISLIILISGLIIGGLLLIIGVIRQNNAKKANQKAYNEAYELSAQKYASAEKRLKEIETEKNELSSQINSKQQACDSISMQSPTWFVDTNACTNEVMSLKTKLGELEQEQFSLEHADYTVYYSLVPPMKYKTFYFLGGGTTIVAVLVAGVLFFITKRREIRAFNIQQQMPVNQEAITKMAPTIGNAAGIVGQDLASGISSGIQQGINNVQADNNVASNSMGYATPQNNVENNPMGYTMSQNNIASNPNDYTTPQNNGIDNQM